MAQEAAPVDADQPRRRAGRAGVDRPQASPRGQSARHLLDRDHAAKGGASKTTSTIGLGEALARYRDDKVVAIDANPANGNLASRVDEPSTGTWRSLIADPHLVSYSDFRHYLGKDSSSGLEVLGSDIGDDVMTGMNLIQAWDKLSRQYPIGLIDCGNQMRDDLTAAILSRVDAVVVVSTTRYDGAAGRRTP